MKTQTMKYQPWLIFATLLICALAVPCAHATLYPLEIFTTDGQYYDDPGVDLFMDVTNGVGIAEFTFYNQSTVDSSIARIYFDDGSLLGISDITGSRGTKFSEIYPGPGNLPAGSLLDPPFVADKEFSIGAEGTPPQKGINNPDEWVKVTFEISGGTLEDVLNELNTGVLRVGVHVIAFPDGSSESGIAVPEPATICLLGLGTLVLLRRRRRP